jgi:serine/threonine protein kinase/Tol biopolymer transport system component
MTDERWPRVKALFQAAVERPVAERAAFLAAETGDDAELRREVESLLASDTSGTGVLDRLPVASASVIADSLAVLPVATAPHIIFAAGHRVGPYEIIAPLGAGAMGEVYRARDTKLNRDVAVKVLPERFSLDPDRSARFTREAQLLATLNHPNIGAIYGLDESNPSTRSGQAAVRALVLELVEGPTLADRIARGSIPSNEALPIARQIAGALEAAHEKGIIHRDLKPANIKIAPDGVVKVLDFGLAKVWDGAPQTDLASSPRLTATNLGERTILGTPTYMSPEQARGQALDRRTDIWAFGCVLYEMLTGRPPFAGETVSDTLAAILEREPDLTRLPAASPPPIRRLLRRCFEKDRTRRLADMADARLDIDDALNGSEIDAPVTPSLSRRRERLTWAFSLLLVGLTAAIVGWAARPAATPETTKAILSVAPSGDSSGGNPLEQRIASERPTRTAVALSPDGKTLVFSAIWGGRPQLYARAMDQFAATPIPGTGGGYSPFFSPDGQWVGFAADGELRKVRLSGGPAVPLGEASALFGASWGDDGTIVYATQRNGGLWRVPDAGGTPESLTTPPPGEYSHRLPHMLPGSRAVIFTIVKGPTLWEDTQIVVRSLETGTQKVLINGGADGRYVSTGHLVYVRLGTLMAVPFDPVRLAVTGAATGVIDDVMQAADRNLSYMHNTLAGQFTVSDTGALVYLTGGAVAAGHNLLAWTDRHGTSHVLPAPPHSYSGPRLSPDGQRVAVYTRDPRGVWSFDLTRGVLSPVTVDGRSDHGLFAPPDGKRIAFRSGDGEGNLFLKAADGSGAIEPLTTSPRSQTPSSWTPDGTTLAFMEEGESRGFFQFDVWLLSIADRTTRPLIHTEANEMTPEFSPDGKWLAYVSSVSGIYQVYVQPYPGPGERHQISINGGEQPAWRADGRELFFVQNGGYNSGGVPTMMSVDIATAPAFRIGTPRALFESPALYMSWGRSYDVAKDGRFLLTPDKEATRNLPPAQMRFEQHWFEELKRLVPVR